MAGKRCSEDLIVGHEMVHTTSLVARPLRTHSAEQAEAIDAALAESGNARTILANRRTRRIIDGHLRVERLLAAGIPRVRVAWVDLDEEVEEKLLATFDAIGGMVGVDDVLAELSADLSFASAALKDLVAGLAGGSDEETTDQVAPDVDPSQQLADEWGVEPGQASEVSP